MPLSRNIYHTYNIHRKDIKGVEEETHLEVTVRRGLHHRARYLYAKKVNVMLRFVARNFERTPQKKCLQNALLRPHLEYAFQTCSRCYRDAELLENTAIQYENNTVDKETTL